MFELRGEWCTVGLSALLLLLGLLVLMDWQGRRKRNRMPEGSRGWPLVGDSINWYYAATAHPSQFLEKQVKRYGTIFSSSLFGKWAVISTDPHFNRFVMQNESRLFQASYPKSFRYLLGKNSILFAQGDRHRKLHATSSNVLRVDRLKCHLLNNIQFVLRQTLNNNLHHHQVILLRDFCRKLAVTQIVNHLLGVSEPEIQDEMVHLLTDYSDGLLSFPINVPGFAFYRAVKAREKILSKIKNRIERYRRDGTAGEVCVLARLLEEEHLPDETISDLIMSLLFAGHESTAKTMLSTMYFLTQTPTALQQLLEEQDGLKKKNDEMLTWEDYEGMPFMQCVIDETLRIGGIASWLMRKAKEDVTYQEYVIPKGCFVIPVLSAVHLDEDAYGADALTFNPWRWMNSHDQEKRNWRKNVYYCPFGGGGRLCAGADLARLQVALFLHHFLTRYRWTQLNQERISGFPSARSINGFQIKLISRLSS